MIQPNNKHQGHWLLEVQEPKLFVRGGRDFRESVLFEISLFSHRNRLKSGIV